MSHTIFLTPITNVPSTVTQLALDCKTDLLSYLYCHVVDEDLRPNQAKTVFSSNHANWLSFPAHKIITINGLGIETLKHAGTDYTASLPAGTVTFGAAVNDIVRAEYYSFPFTDQQLVDLTTKSIQEVSVLIYRPINENNIPQDYLPVICKRLYTNVLKALIIEARNYFQVSVAGRSINKTNVVQQFSAIIEQNEKQLMEEIEPLRHFNKTNRILPTYALTEEIKSDSQII